MLKNLWPLWLLAGALVLCLAAVAWLHQEARDTATALGTLQSAHEGTIKVLQELRENQTRQNDVLQGWEERRQATAKTGRAKAKLVREAGKNADFTSWAAQPLPADAHSVLQSSGPAR